MMSFRERNLCGGSQVAQWFRENPPWRCDGPVMWHTKTCCMCCLPQTSLPVFCAQFFKNCKNLFLFMSQLVTCTYTDTPMIVTRIIVSLIDANTEWNSVGVRTWFPKPLYDVGRIMGFLFFSNIVLIWVNFSCRLRLLGLYFHYSANAWRMSAQACQWSSSKGPISVHDRKLRMSLLSNLRKDHLAQYLSRIASRSCHSLPKHLFLFLSLFTWFTFTYVYWQCWKYRWWRHHTRSLANTERIVVKLQEYCGSLIITEFYVNPSISGPNKHRIDFAYQIARTVRFHCSSHLTAQCFTYRFTRTLSPYPYRVLHTNVTQPFFSLHLHFRAGPKQCKPPPRRQQNMILHSSRRHRHHHCCCTS